MTKFIVLLLSVLVLGSTARADELHRAEIDVGPAVCDNWVSFPSATWTNTTGGAIRIRRIEAKFVSAASLVNEMSLWFTRGPLQGGTGIFSYGVDSWSLPSYEQHPDRFSTGSDWITVNAGETLTATVNCGPVNLPNGGKSAPATYWGVLIFYYTPAP